MQVFLSLYIFQKNIGISNAPYAQIELPAFALEKPQRELNADIYRGYRFTFPFIFARDKLFFKVFCQFSMWLDALYSLVFKILLIQSFHSKMTQLRIY